MTLGVEILAVLVGQVLALVLVLNLLALVLGAVARALTLWRYRKP